MLGVSVKSKYGLCVIIELAERFGQGPVQTRVLAEQHGIPHTYLEQVLNSLKRQGLITSFRGKQGGYVLSKSPEEILIIDVIQCLDGPTSLSQGHKGCESLDFFWEELDGQIAALVSRSLATVILDKQRREKMVTYTI